MAGGKGTRISSLANNIPKPMILLCGKPVLEHEILCLKNQGFKDFIITVSHFGNVIMDYFGNGSKFGVNIEYYFEKTPLGNAGALFKIKDKLTGDFLLINGDLLFNVDFSRFIKYHKEKGGLVTLITHPNSHPFDSGLIVTDSQNAVIDLLAKEDFRPKWYKNRVNAGIHIISPILLNTNVSSETVDLDRHILKPLCKSGKMYAYDSPEYIKDMGTPERFSSITRDFENEIIEKKCLLNKQKAIFLDRDGTINKYVGFLTNIDEFELISGVADAIKKINQSEYLAILVTNQPVVARGDITFDELDMIHNKMETLLGAAGAYIDAIYFCPHHPDSGFKGEVKELKISCDCRKPKPGMLLKAANDYNLDLSKSWIIGDDKIDVEAGKAAGCRTLLIDSNSYDDKCSVKTLLSGVDLILDEKNKFY